MPLKDLRCWRNEEASRLWRTSEGSVLVVELPGLGAEIVIFCSPANHIFGMLPRISKEFWNDWVFSLCDAESANAPLILNECVRQGVKPEEVKDLFPVDIDGSGEITYDVSPHWFSKWLIRSGAGLTLVEKYREFVCDVGRFALMPLDDSFVEQAGYWLPSGGSKRGSYPAARLLFDASVEDKDRQDVMGRLLALRKIVGSGNPDVLGLKPFDLVEPHLSIPILDPNLSPLRGSFVPIHSARRLGGSEGVVEGENGDDYVWRLNAVRAEIVASLDWPSAVYKIEQLLGFERIDDVSAQQPYGQTTVAALRMQRQKTLEKYPTLASYIV